jgi:hypothetical protein
MLDSGKITIYSVENIAERGAHPVAALTLKAEEYFEKRNVGLTRFYAAKQANVTVDMVARIWRNETISTQDIAQIDDQYFEIMQVQHTTDADEMPVTDLSLERTDKRFDTI